MGKDIHKFKVGDRVQIAPAIGCGTCPSCKRGRTNLCDALKTIGFDYDGTFAEYMEIPSHAFARDYVTKVPENLSATQAVLAEPIACVMNAQSYLHIEGGDTVAVFGSGFIGTMHATLAYAQNASKVFLIELNEHRIEMAKSVHPDLIVINSDKENLEETIACYTDGHGVDVAITACSVGAAQQNAMGIIGKRGRVSLFGGLPKVSNGFIDSNIIHYKEVSVHGAHASTVEQNRKVLSMISDGTLDVKPFTNSLFALKNIERAFAELNQESIVKAILIPEGK